MSNEVLDHSREEFLYAFTTRTSSLSMVVLDLSIVVCISISPAPYKVIPAGPTLHLCSFTYPIIQSMKKNWEKTCSYIPLPEKMKFDIYA